MDANANQAAVYPPQVPGPRTAATIQNIPTGTEKINPKSKDVRTYYSYLNGSKYYFADGGAATFTGGMYQIDAENPANALRVQELEYVVDIPTPVFSRVRVRVRKSDSKLMREVNHAGGGVDHEAEDEALQVPSVGMMNSLNIAPMAKQN